MSDRPIVHIEISAKDLESAGKFYSDLFGWKMDHQPEFNYTTFDPGTPPGGGLNPVNEGNPAGTVIVYVDSTDIDADLARVEKLGGKMLVPRTEIPGFGWFGIFEDPTGNRIGLYTAMQPG